MNELVHTCIQVISCCWADFASCPLFANVIKNNIISSVMHIIICLLETE